MTLWISFALLASSADSAPRLLQTIETAGGRVDVELLADGLRVTSALCFLPDGRLLIAQRKSAALSALDSASGARTAIDGLPPIFADDDAGLHDVVLHPDFAHNGWIYFSYSAGDKASSTLAIDRARLRGASLVDRQAVFRAAAANADAYHYGGRMVFVAGLLYVTVGDRHREADAQSMRSHAGKILRLRDDGGAPPDNPFAGNADALPEIWALGSRHAQGIAWDAARSSLWFNEHGPLGGDELNQGVAGANYGWPTVSWGLSYEGGAVGTGKAHADGLTRPQRVWSPALAPSDLIVYSGAAFSAWRGDLLMGALAGRALIRLSVRDGQVVLEERIATELKARVRAVKQGLDGLVYLGTDDGRLLRLRPSPQKASVTP